MDKLTPKTHHSLHTVPINIDIFRVYSTAVNKIHLNFCVNFSILKKYLIHHNMQSWNKGTNWDKSSNFTQDITFTLSPPDPDDQDRRRDWSVPIIQAPLAPVSASGTTCMAPPWARSMCMLGRAVCLEVQSGPSLVTKETVGSRDKFLSSSSQHGR